MAKNEIERDSFIRELKTLIEMEELTTIEQYCYSNHCSRTKANKNLRDSEDWERSAIDKQIFYIKKQS